jgi:hypothetical protein
MDEGVRLPNRSRTYTPTTPPAESVFVPSKRAKEERSKKGWGIGLAIMGLLVVIGVAALVILPRLRPKPRDAVETVAGDYLDALVRQDEETAGRLGIVEEPPGIASYGNLTHHKSKDQSIRGSFATLAALNKKIDKDFTYDATAGRFTPKNPLGLAGETLDKLHEAKDEAKKSGMYDKMKSGNPDDIFDSAEQLGKMMEKVSETLTPQRLLPTYKMLIESAKPPLTGEALALAMVVAEDPTRWSALLKRPFWTLRPDGPFVYEKAEVTATGRDKLASLGDPPSRFRLELVRFRLEAIDTGWKVVSARRAQPGDDKPAPPSAPPATSSYADAKPSPGESPTPPTAKPSGSLGDAPSPEETPTGRPNF